MCSNLAPSLISLLLVTVIEDYGVLYLGCMISRGRLCPGVSQQYVFVQESMSCTGDLREYKKQDLVQEYSIEFFGS